MKSVLELLELQLEMLARIGAGLAGEPQAPVVVHPFEMHGVTGILLALKPVAGDIGKNDLAKAVLPGERLPDRQLGDRLRSHIGPKEPGAFLHRIGFGRAALLGPRARVDGVVIGLLDATAGLVHQPAVIVAADSGFLDETVGEVGAPVRAVPVEQAEAPRHVLIQHQVLAHEAHGLDRIAVELAGTADRHPVAAKKLAHRRSRADLGKKTVLLGTEHARPRLIWILPDFARESRIRQHRSGSRQNKAPGDNLPGSRLQDQEANPDRSIACVDRAAAADIEPVVQPGFGRVRLLMHVCRGNPHIGDLDQLLRLFLCWTSGIRLASPARLNRLDGVFGFCARCEDLVCHYDQRNRGGLLFLDLAALCCGVLNNVKLRRRCRREERGQSYRHQ